MRKHIRDILQYLRELDISARIVGGKSGHVHLEIACPGGRRHHITILSSPADTDTATRNAARQARRITAAALEKRA